MLQRSLSDDTHSDISPHPRKKKMLEYFGLGHFQVS